MTIYSNVYDDLNLYDTPEKFIIQARSTSKLLIIDRTSETLSLENNSGQIPTSDYGLEFCGLLGSVQLLAGHYLIIAIEREYVGSIAGHMIWRLKKTKLIPYFRSTLHLSAEENADNNVYINMIEQVLSTPYLYFSYSYDLTHTMQRLHDMGPDFFTQPLLERADQRFVWNNSLLKNFQKSDLQNFCLPVMQGFISIKQVVINGNGFLWSVISRRSNQRSGTRLFRRGIDRSGCVANFVETEQIVEYQGDRASFVQVRGSIPLFWTQLPDLRYKPPPTILDIGIEDQQLACSQHFEMLSLLYGRQILIDLVDHHGAEGKLQRAYENIVNRLSYPSVRYEGFDFHAECRHMRWDRLSILLDRLSLDQDEIGFFLLMRDGSLGSLQDGVFRTNCVDCLDRTNVVQSMLAKRCLSQILRKLNILLSEQTIEDHSSIEQIFKEVWADNADMISIQYSGTGALKTDFTRTGKRTRIGMIKDGVNSLTRYFKNNFTDGYRQDAIDLFHGVAHIRSPFHVERGWRYITFPLVLLTALAMFVACSILPAEYSTETLLFLLFWGTMVVATLTTIFKHGSEFVDKPRLT